MDRFCVEHDVTAIYDEMECFRCPIDNKRIGRIVRTR